MDWVVEFYKDKKGRVPVIDFLASLTKVEKVKITRLIDLLSNYGVLLKEPYTRQIRGKIRELRIIDKEGNIRILYFSMTGRRFIMLHGFKKKTGKTPVKELEIAERRMKNFIERQGGSKT